MKLDKNSITYIQNVVETAKLVGIDSVIIEPNLVRGYENQVVIYQNENVPDMPFGSIGMNRLDVFTARYDIAKTQDQFTIEADIDEGSAFARSITMKAKGMKVDYRCANPTAIKAPRQINDTMKYRVSLNAEAVVYLQKAQAAMKAEHVTIVSDDGVSFELSDVNNDTFKYKFADKVQVLTDGNGKFAHRYPIKVILSLFKQNATGHFDIGAKGMAAFSINDLKVFVLPQV
jgi:hypothetical protein